MNYGFEQMVYEMPSHLVDVKSLVLQAGFGMEMVERLRSGGLQRIPVSDEKPLPHLVKGAIERLSKVVPDLSVRTQGIIFAHSIPILAPAEIPFLDLCLDHFAFEAIPRVAVEGQPCAILHFAVQLASYWLNEIHDNCGIILIGADKAYSAKERIFFGSAMGDVAVAGFITREAKRNRVLASVSESEIIAYSGEDSPKQDIERFRKLNPLYIRHAIETCLQQGNSRLDELKFIIPHTPYTMIWDTIAVLLQFPRERIITDYLSETGHLNSNDSFVHYIRAVNEGRIQNGDLVMLVNPGFGGTRGCTLIQR